MNIHKINIFFLLMLFLSFQSKGQMRVALVKTDCAEKFKVSFCEEIYQAVDNFLDSLQKELPYKYVSYDVNMPKENLALVYINFKSRKHKIDDKSNIESESGFTKEDKYYTDICLNVEIKDAVNGENILGPACVGPIRFNRNKVDFGPLSQILITIHKSITGFTPSWSEITPQTYFENPSLFFEFDKIKFDVNLPKQIRKEIDLMVHNILAQEQVWERKFNFYSKYTDKKVEKTEDAKLHISFEENESDKSTFLVNIYLEGEKIIDIISLSNEKMKRKIFVNKVRIKNRDYTELINKLSLVYFWILINSHV